MLKVGRGYKEGVVLKNILLVVRVYVNIDDKQVSEQEL